MTWFQAAVQDGESGISDSTMVKSGWHIFYRDQRPAFEGGMITQLSLRLPRVPVLGDVGVLEFQGFGLALRSSDEYREHWLIQKLGPRILWVSAEHEPRLAVVCNQRDERFCRPVLFLGRIEDVQYVLH